MTDALIERLSAPAATESRSKFTAPPWPEGLAPQLVRVDRDPTGPLPAVDVVVCMWTSAEKQAVADVFNAPENDWNFYAKDFASYEADLTDRSPAKDLRRLGEYAVVTVGSKHVGLFHSQLHLATDSVALPLRRLIAQVIGDAGCSLWIDTGTAGGIGPTVVEGDTVVGENLIFDCTGAFKAEPYAHELFACTADLSTINWGEATALITVNAGLVKPEATRDPKVWTGHDVITCDSFLFDDVEDSFGLQTYDDGAALVEEMDCATLGLVAQDLGEAMPKYTSLRSVSDPQMPDLHSVEKEQQEASKIYDQFGYGAQVATSVACWAVIASL